MSTQESDILTIMRAVADADASCDLWWRTDGEYYPVTFLVNCNDLFAWACSDAEELTIENLHVFLKAHEQTTAYGNELFCCRVRGERPQGAYYRGMTPEIVALFDACGPSREICHSNPLPKP